MGVSWLQSLCGQQHKVVQVHHTTDQQGDFVLGSVTDVGAHCISILLSFQMMIIGQIDKILMTNSCCNVWLMQHSVNVTESQKLNYSSNTPE